MKNAETVSRENNNFFSFLIKNWDNLDQSQKHFLSKIWKVLTYKWQWQIFLNIPFLLWWLLDLTFIEIHQFDINLINSLNLPDWIISLIGFKPSNT